MKPVTVAIAIRASIDKVWEYFTAPQHITQWYFAGDEWHSPHAENDLQTGGSFKISMAAKDGSFAFDFEGIYSDVVVNKAIAYTLGDGREVKITFEGNAVTTQITEIFDPESTNAIEIQKGGWQAILDNFKKYTEDN